MCAEECGSLHAIHSELRGLESDGFLEPIAELLRGVPSKARTQLTLLLCPE